MGEGRDQLALVVGNSVRGRNASGAADRRENFEWGVSYPGTVG